MDQTRLRISVLDNELKFCRALARLLRTHGFEVMTFTRGEEFRSLALQQLPNCLLLDLHMQDLNGFEVLERISARHVPALVITGHDQPGNAQRVRALGALDYLLKPVNELQLLAAIRAAIHPISLSPPCNGRPSQRRKCRTRSPSRSSARFGPAERPDSMVTD
jgi:DNA-binding response OmpR family regulator